MTFLEMCQKVVEKCGISGTLTSVSGQRGEMQRVIGWVNESWHSIQLKNPNWKWMRYEFQFNTTAGVNEYSVATIGATNFRRWHTDGFRIQRVSTGNYDNRGFSEMLWSDFRARYLFGPQVNAAPYYFAIKPRDNSILLGPKPEDVYQVSGEYQRAPYYMVLDGDIPDMPDEYHMMIVHAARKKYALYENAPEVLSEATGDYNVMYGSLVMTQLEEFTGAGPLA